MLLIEVIEDLPGGLAVTTSAGHALRMRLEVALQQADQVVVLSFAGAVHVTTAFLAAVFDETLLMRSLPTPLLIVGIENRVLSLRVREAVRLAADPEYRERVAAAWARALDDAPDFT